MSFINNPRVHACKDIHAVGDGHLVECGRTPGHLGAHMDSTASHRWMPPLEVVTCPVDDLTPEQAAALAACPVDIRPALAVVR